MKKTFPVMMLLACASLAPVLAQSQPPPSSTAAPQGSQQPPQSAQAPPQGGLKEKMFYGGGIGFGFGDVDWVSVSPMVGIRVIPKLSTGVGLTYRHTEDDRADESLSTSDFGGDVFVQYTLVHNVFAMAEYEYMNYQYFDVNSVKTSSSFNSVYVGGGLFQPMGEHAAMVFSALYNLSYSSSDPSPYGSPWLYSAGVSVGF